MIYPIQVQDIYTAPFCRIRAFEATTPEELLALIEPAPPSPSVFLDHPLMAHGDPEPPQDDQTLAYISHMLMEEDIVDKFFYQYPDHPKLLQAEQPFAQILSGAATTSSNAQESSAPDTHASTVLRSKGNNTDILVSRFFSGEVQDPTFFVNSTCVVEPNSMVFPSEGSTSMDMLSSIAFFKGIEEANMFLPRDSGVADGRGRKHRFDMSGETEADLGRRSKQIVALVHTDAEEEATALEKLDRLILNGYDIYPNEMQEVVRVTLDKENKAAQLSIYRRGRRGVRQTAVTDLETLLIRCAEAVASNDQRSGYDLLERIKWHSSPTGDARQRLAHYFAQGLEARMAGTGSQLYRALMGKRTSVVELIKGYHLYMAACCFLKVALLFSNRTIYNTVAGRRKLHIVHYGINTGFQWAELLRMLADREDGLPEVRITGINYPQPGFHPAEQIEEAGRRLSNCASKFGLPFKFRAIASKPEAVRAEDLHIDPNEVLVVNSVFFFRIVMDESLTFDKVSPRDMVLNTIRKMRLSVFIQSVVNGSYSAAFFMTRFRETLYYFTSFFDVMETTIPRDNEKRLLVERDIFARSAMNMIACEGTDRVERPQNYREWQARNQRAGLRQLPLDPDIVLMLKDIVKNDYHKHFTISEDHRWLLQGWKGRVLCALSIWAADDASGSEVT
ncbi:hypothetical protein ACQ4PT_062350 [Festuca glaucescens]